MKFNMMGFVPVLRAVVIRRCFAVFCVSLYPLSALAAPGGMAQVVAQVVPDADGAGVAIGRRAGTPTDTAGEAYRVNGFRSARFGDSETKVRAAIARDFSVSGSKVQRYTHPLQRTPVLTVELEKLEPSESPATLRYIFGYKSRTLIQVDVLWQTRVSSREDVEQLVSTGSLLAAHFTEYRWKEDSVRRLALLSDSAILVYQAHDQQTGAVRLLLSGVRISKEEKPGVPPDTRKGVQLLQVEATDDAGQRGVYSIDAPLGEESTLSLLLNYVGNRDKADIYRVSRSDF